jgi:hypothetical protein
VVSYIHVLCIDNLHNKCFHSNVGSSYAGGQWAAGDEPLYYIVSPKDVVIAKPRLMSSSLSYCTFMHLIYALEGKNDDKHALINN